MRDRIVEHPNRYIDQNGNVLTLTPSPGTITEEGTLINKANLLADSTVKRISDLGYAVSLESDETVSHILSVIGENPVLNKTIVSIVTRDSAGVNAVGATIVVKDSDSNVVWEHLVVAGTEAFALLVENATYSVSLSMNYVGYENGVATFTANGGSVIVNLAETLLLRDTSPLMILTSGNVPFAPYITHIDASIIGGGGGGASKISAGGGGAGAYMTNIYNIEITNQTVTATIGARGVSGQTSTSSGSYGTDGGASSLTIGETTYTANGGAGGGTTAGGRGGTGGGNPSGNGGTNGGNGVPGGTGDGLSKHIFGDPTLLLCCGGGAGGGGIGGDGGGGHGNGYGHATQIGAGGGAACNGTSNGRWGGNGYQGAIFIRAHIAT